MFPTTSWTILAEATLSGGETERQALDKLCKSYWQPVASVIKAKGTPSDKVEDLTQDFFVTLMEGSFFRKAMRHRGSFRGFLLNALRNFLTDEYRKSVASKRGGGLTPVELTDDIGAGETASQHFDAVWAETIFNSAVDEIGKEIKNRRSEKAWAVLRNFLTLEQDVPSYEELAKLLNCSLGSARTEIYRIRSSFRDILRREVSKTVSAPHEIDEELDYLKQALMRARDSDNG